MGRPEARIDVAGRSELIQVEQLAQAVFPKDFTQSLKSGREIAPAQILRALIESTEPTWALVVLDRFGRLDQALPELAACRGVIQNDFHHMPVFEHTLLVCGHVQRIAGDPERFYPQGERFCESIRSSKKALFLAALGHDLGKPVTKAIKEDGHATFYRHEAASAEIFTSMADRLEIEPGLAQEARGLISSHMHFGPVAARYFTGEATEKALTRLLNRYPESWPELAALSLADISATRGPLVDPSAIEYVRRLPGKLSAMLAEKEKQELLKPPISGFDIMKRFDLLPGPEVKRRLEQSRSIFAKEPDLNAEELLARLAELDLET
jgi:poly(A) polymerase